MATTRETWLLWVLFVVSVLPHLVVGWALARDNGLTWALLALIGWNLLPLAPGLVLGYATRYLMAAAWLMATMAASWYAAWLGALSPRGSTAVLVFVFFPIWNVVLIGPVSLALVAAWTAIRRRRTVVASLAIGGFLLMT